MADLQLLTATARDSKEKPADLRRAGKIPGVIYGPGLAKDESLPVTTAEGEFLRVFRKVGGSQLFEIDLAGKKHEVLFQDWQYHPVTDRILHFDALAVKRGEKITTEIPLKIVGVSPAAKSGGVLNAPLTAIEVRVLPRDLIPEIEVDISGLDDFEKAISVADLGVDAEKFEILTNTDSVVATVSAPREEEEPEESAEAAEPEIVGEKKEEDTGEEGEKKE